MKKILFFPLILVLTAGFQSESSQLQYMVRMTVFQTYTHMKDVNRTFDIVVFDQAYAMPTSGNFTTDKFESRPKQIGEYKSMGFHVDYIVEWDISVTAVKAYWKVNDLYKGEVSWFKELPLQDKKSPFKISEPLQLKPNTSYTTEQGVVDIE